MSNPLLGPVGGRQIGVACFGGLALVLSACSSTSNDQEPGGGSGSSETSGDNSSSGGSAMTTGGAGIGTGGTSSAGGNSGGANAGGVSAGGANAAGSNAGGAAGTAGSGGAAMGAAGGGADGGGVAVTCANPSSTLPAGAPVLQAGTWKNISPQGVPFDDKATAFSQGITLDPCNASTLYFSVEGYDQATSKAGLYKSTDAGSSWTKMGQLDEPINVVVDPSDSKHLYASDGVRGGTQGFWVSHDAGVTWTMPAGFKTTAASVNSYDVYRVDPDPTDFKHVLVSFHSYWHGGDNSGVFESFDGGDAWTIHEPDPGWSGSGGYDVLFLYNPALGLGDRKTWLFGTQGKGYWRTTDAGASWKKVTDVSMEHGGTTLYYSKEGNLYASATPHIIRSKDNGATWTEIGTYNGFLSIIGDGTTLYTAGHGGGHFVVAKENNDLTWTDFNSQTFAEGPFQMAFDAKNGILYSSNIRGGAWALKVK